MAPIWELERAGVWMALDCGNPKTAVFVEGRYGEYRDGGAPRRQVRLAGQDFRVDFSRMTIKSKDGTIENVRRRVHEESTPAEKNHEVCALAETNHEESAPAGTKYGVHVKEHEPGTPGDPLRGLSLHYLSTQLLKELLQADLTPEAKIRDIEPVVIRSKSATVTCPRDGRVGSAYVDAVHGDDNVGRATHMLSYTWGYQVREIIDTLTAWCERNDLRPFEFRIWMCCFCINQHRVVEAQSLGKIVPFDEFRHEFESRVKGIGKVLALMGSWQMTLYTTRVWCVFELYTAMQLQEHNPDAFSLEIVLSPREAELFRQTLIEQNRLDAVWRSLTGIQVEKADSFVKADRDRILQLVKDGPGYARVNQEIVHHLHDWFTLNSEDHLRERLELEAFSGRSAVQLQEMGKARSFARACVRVGDMLERVSRHADAFEILGKGHELLKAVGELETLDCAVHLRIYGSVQRRLDKHDEALNSYMQAQGIHRKLGSTTTTEYASLMQDLGRIHGDFAKLDLELKCHMEAKQIREQEGTFNTPEGACLLRSIGMVHLQNHDYTTALNFFQQSKDLHEKTQSLVTPEGAAALHSVGDVLSSVHPPSLEEALKAHEHAHKITEQLGLGSTPRAIVQLRRLAHLHHSLGHQAKAQELRVLARAIGQESKKKREQVLLRRKRAECRRRSRPVDWQVEASSGVYFEIAVDDGYSDAEKRGFPHSLVPMTTKPTVGLAARHMDIVWGSPDTLTVEGREWTLQGDVYEQTQLLGQLQEVVQGGTVTGYLSPLHAVNLSDDARVRAGIPSAARYFMFSYPVRITIGDCVARAPRSADPDLAFLRNGGYVYLDESMKSIVCMNAIFPSMSGGLRFGPPLKWEHDWTRRMISAGRFRPITVDELRQSGLTHFCWIRPNEVMWFDGDGSGGSPICPFGGFAYIRRPGAADTNQGVKRSGTCNESFTPAKRGSTRSDFQQTSDAAT